MEFLKSIFDSIGAMSLKNFVSLTSKVLAILFVISILTNSIVWLNDEFLLFVSFSLIYYFGYHGLNSTKLKVSVAGVQEMIKDSLEAQKAAFYSNKDRTAQENARNLLRFRNKSILYNTWNLATYAKRSLENLTSLLQFQEVSLMQQKKDIFEHHLNSLVSLENQYQNAILERILNKPLSSKAVGTTSKKK